MIYTEKLLAALQKANEDDGGHWYMDGPPYHDGPCDECQECGEETWNIEYGQCSECGFTD